MGRQFAEKSWQDVAKKMQDYRDRTISEVHPSIPDVPRRLPKNVTQLPRELLSEREIWITETETSSLASKLSSGEITALEVTKAFLRRAGLASRLTNCLTELLTTSALKRAEELDEYMSTHGKPFGPLHGVPISVKEHMNMKGLDVNSGYIAWVGTISLDDAHVVAILRAAGAVFHARTTQPQTVMHLECANNIYGTTINPYNSLLTSGGSSGGEGSLIGLRGSCLGIGSDIGGSIRSPAANCGVFGFRPTSYRLPVHGMADQLLSHEQVVTVIGPLSTSLEGMELFMRTIISAKPWLKEPSLIPFHWRQNEDYLGRTASGARKLKIGVLHDDGIVRPHPPVLRAIQELESRLRGTDGIELVEWRPYRHDYAWTITSTLYFPDGGDEERDAIAAGAEPWLPLSRWILLDNPNVRRLSMAENWRWTVERERYRAEYARLWSRMGGSKADVDVILCPVGPGAAPPLECARYWAYTSQWNILDYPAAVFPVTKVDPKVDVKEPYKPRNEQDKYNYDLYDPERDRGVPVSLQLVGKRYEDEKVFQALELILEKAGLPTHV